MQKNQTQQRTIVLHLYISSNLMKQLISLLKVSRLFTLLLLWHMQYIVSGQITIITLWFIFFLGREVSMQSDHERAVTDPVHPEDSAVALQCTVLTQSCAGEHNVYWFRRESGESPPGIIFTQERRNAQCERRSDVNSTADKCIYNLPKRNLSLSDAAIYYCAVAACGEILFGDATKPDVPGVHLSSTILSAHRFVANF